MWPTKSKTQYALPASKSLASKFMTQLLYKLGLGLAIALIVCLFPMPYGYYTLVRFAAMIILGCMAYCYYKEGKMPLCILAGSLALLFQPLVKITLDRETWNFVDVAVALALILQWYRNHKQSKRQS